MTFANFMSEVRQLCFEENIQYTGVGRGEPLQNVRRAQLGKNVSGRCSEGVLTVQL